MSKWLTNVEVKGHIRAVDHQCIENVENNDNKAKSSTNGWKDLLKFVEVRDQFNSGWHQC